MFFGKIIGGLIGYSVWHMPGLILGVLVGHTFDRGLHNALRFGSPENVERGDSFEFFQSIVKNKKR